MSRSTVSDTVPEAVPSESQSEVEALLDAMGLPEGSQRMLVAAVYALVRDTFPTAKSSLKYGGIQFSLGPAFCGIYAYSQHVSVELSHGAKIPGPCPHLEGKGALRRHMKLRILDDLYDKQLGHYLPLALAAALSARS